MDIEETVSNISSNDRNDYQDDSDSFNFSLDESQTITSSLQDVKNPKKFTYIAIGRLTLLFRLLDVNEYFTCFLIDTNVVITLASNLDNPNKGGKAKLVSTTFSEEKVKWENIVIEGEEKTNKKKDKKKENENKSLVIYGENIGSE